MKCIFTANEPSPLLVDHHYRRSFSLFCLRVSRTSNSYQGLSFFFLQHNSSSSILLLPWFCLQIDSTANNSLTLLTKQESKAWQQDILLFPVVACILVACVLQEDIRSVIVYFFMYHEISLHYKMRVKRKKDYAIQLYSIGENQLRTTNPSKKAEASALSSRRDQRKEVILL